MRTPRFALLAALMLPALTLSSGGADAQIATRTVTIAVAVDSHKPTGEAWDAFGGAPDIALCTTSALGTQCFGAAGSPATTAPTFTRGRCQDAFACVFTATVPTTGPVSLAIFDVDVSRHDVIGRCALPGNGRTAGPCGAARIVAR